VGDRDQGERNANFERLRVLGALGIVCFHTQDGLAKTIGYAGLPLFLLLTVILSLSSRPASFRSFARGKVQRLLLPWAAWVVVYLAADLSVAAARGDPLIDVLAELNPFFGTQLVLWYLSFVFCALVLAQLLHRTLRRPPGLDVVASLAVGAVVVAILPWVLADPPSAPLPIPQFVFATPGVLWGMAIGYAARLQGLRRLVGLTLSVGGVFASGFVLAVHGDAGGASDLLVAYGIGAVLVCSAVLWPGRALGPVARHLAPLTYGIYLVHPLVILVLSRVPGFDTQDPLYGVPVVFAVAAATTALIRRVPHLRRIV
jgi:peptidoglycan/LPS O-acetylase OafA/YrhL